MVNIQRIPRARPMRPVQLDSDCQRPPAHCTTQAAATAQPISEGTCVSVSLRFMVIKSNIAISPNVKWLTSREIELVAIRKATTTAVVKQATMPGWLKRAREFVLDWRSPSIKQASDQLAVK